MSSGNLRVLIISFFFPPFKRVGGRRWAKHAKYFYKLDLPFYVLAGDYSGFSPWDKDISAFNESIFRIKSVERKKPYFLRTLPGNIIEKIIWKLSLYKNNIIRNFFRGNYNDISQKSEKQYYTKAVEIIEKHKLNTVILSVGPFSYSKIIIGLKLKYPNLKIVLDYRDYWEDEFPGLNKRQIKFEKKIQQKVVRHVDLILSPNSEMQKHYAETYNKPSYLLPHCVDIDDLNNLQPYAPGNEMRLIYGGAFYNRIGNNIELIKKLIDQLSKNQSVVADFYVSIKGYEKELEHASIRRFDFIESGLFFEKVVQSDYVILILPPNRANAMSSKFFELVSLRKPILYFGDSGVVSQFILSNKLGYHVTELNVEETAKLCLTNRSSKTIPDLTYNIDQHTFDFQTKKLITQLQQL